MVQCEVMFCRVCGSRVRVWESYRTCRSFGYGYGIVTELTQVLGIVALAYKRYKKCCTRTPGIVARGVQDSPGTGMNIIQKSHKLRVRV